MKKRTLIPTAVVGLCAATSLGLLGLQSVAPQAAEQKTDNTSEVFVKRDEDQTEVVLVADDDDNDTNDNTNQTNTQASRNTGVSRATRDHTRSNFTSVSRDRDLSRSDKTRDWTDDGKGPKKRDWSANTTNDRSRNDTRR